MLSRWISEKTWSVQNTEREVFIRAFKNFHENRIFYAFPFYFFFIYLIWGTIWDNVFQNEPSKICVRQPLKNLNDLLSRFTIFYEIYILDNYNHLW